MTDDQFTAYRDDRYSEQLSYYDRRALANQRGYRICGLYIIIVSVAITPLISLDEAIFGWGIILAKVLSPTVAIAAGVMAHFRFLENWLRFRFTWDSLKQELVFRDAGIRDYAATNNRNALFVDRVESLIAQEGVSWLNVHAQRDRAVPR